MLHKFGPDARFPLTAAFSLSAVMAVMVAVAPSAQAQTAPAVSADPASTSGGFTVSPSAVQYFSAGATFPLLLNRQYYDYYGIAIPPIAAQPGSNGLQPTSPAGSPRLNTAQFNYCGTGSGNGRGIFTGLTSGGVTSTGSTCSFTASTTGSVVVNPPYPSGTAAAPFPTNTANVTPLFAGTDQELSSGDLANYTANRLSTRGNPIQVPTVFGGIAAGFNQGVAPSLNLTTTALCGIFDGSITNYSQLGATGSTSGLTGPISVFIRSDNSGTTNGFTSYLALACPQATGVPYYITAGVNAFPTVPQTASFTRVAGNNGVTNSIAATAGGLGYIEASFTVPFSTTAPNGSPAPFAARVQNPNTGTPTSPTVVFVGPTQSAIRAAVPLTGGTITYTGDPTYACVLSVNGLPSSPTPVLLPSSTAYPIISPTYTLAYTRYPTTAERDAVRGVYSGFVLLNRAQPVIGPNDQIAQGLGFVLPPNGLRGQARNCINTITSP